MNTGVFTSACSWSFSASSWQCSTGWPSHARGHQDHTSWWLGDHQTTLISSQGPSVSHPALPGHWGLQSWGSNSGSYLIHSFYSYVCGLALFLLFLYFGVWSHTRKFFFLCAWRSMHSSHLKSLHHPICNNLSTEKSESSFVGEQSICNPANSLGWERPHFIHSFP